MLELVTSTTPINPRPRNRRLGRTAAVGTALLLVLAACGDPNTVDPAASPTPSTGGSVVDTPDPDDVVATTIPAPDPVPTSQVPGDQAFDVEAARVELEAARQRWADQDFRSYTFDYFITCFCPQVEIRASVIEGRLVETSVDSLETEFPENTFIGMTVDDWFDRIDDAIDTAFDVQVSYDDTWGYPTSIYIDEDEMTADEENGMTFDGFFHRPAPIADLVNQPYPCGYGFWTATPTQGVALQLGFNEEPATGTYDVADLDIAELQLGHDLMANWCDDVMEEGEPVAEITETWAITAGTLDIEVDANAATATITGLVATTPDGTNVPLGDGLITNESWGFFAG